MRRAGLLAAAVTAYMVAAWMVAPGFYDGFGPAQPYNWTCPPPQAGANQKPSSAHAVIKVVGGVSDAASVTPEADAQIIIGFLPGAFDPTGKTSITVDITPLPTCPEPPGIRFVTNIYHISADAPLVKSSPLALLYSNLLPPPTAAYFATDPAGPWKSIGAAPQSPFFTIDTTTKELGYFAAGYASASPAPGAITVGGGQVLPIVVAVIIVLVVLAGLPLAVMRRRRSGGKDSSDEDDASS